MGVEMFCKVVKGNVGTWMGKRLETQGNKEGTFQWAEMLCKVAEGDQGTGIGKQLETKGNKKGTC